MKLALFGYARSGKDTLYEMLQETQSELIHRLAFGDALRECFQEKYPDIPIINPKPRELLEKFGKEEREKNVNVWVDFIDKNYAELVQRGQRDFVITDLRQPNEAKWAFQNGFKLIYVNCPPEIRKARSQGDTDWKPVNPSEEFIEIIRWDNTVNNDGSLTSLVDVAWYLKGVYQT